MNLNGMEITIDKNVRERDGIKHPTQCLHIHKLYATGNELSFLKESINDIQIVLDNFKEILAKKEKERESDGR